MKKFLLLFSALISLLSINTIAQTNAEYVNSLIGVGINGQGIIDDGASAWPDSYYQQIADAGFESVRIVYEPGQTLYTITNSTLVLLKSIVDKCISYGLFPVIDYHITPLWFQLNYSAEQATIFVNNLGLMADYFKGYDYDELVLELVNEPNYISASTWNALLASAITKIRTYDADRVIMVSPLYYAHIEGLSDLTMPADNNLILSIHYYNPGWIYLQNCPWTNPDLNGEGYAGMTWRNIQPFVDNLEEEFKYVRDFQADNNNIPVNIGEWGSVIYGDTANRRLYFTMLSNWFTDQGYSHMVWEYDHYFGIMQNRAATGYGSATREWYPGFPEAITSDPLVLYEYDSTDLVVGNFSSTTGWSTYENNGGDVSISVSSGELVINVVNGGTGYQDVRVYTPPLDMYKDSIYRISYTIRTGSGTKTYAHKEAGWNTWYYVYDLGTTTDTITETIVRDSTNTDTYYEFMLGGSTGTLYISNFRIEQITPSSTPVEVTYESVTDTIWFKNYDIIHKGDTMYNICTDTAVIYESAFVSSNISTDTVGMINFCSASDYWDEPGWTSFYDGQSSVEISSGIYATTNRDIESSSYGEVDGEYVFPYLVQKSYWYANNTDNDPVIITISGLDDSCTYDFYSLPSRNDDVSPPRLTYMYIESDGDTVEAVGNLSNLLTVTDVSPTSGNIVITYEKSDGVYGPYLNGLIIIENCTTSAVYDTTQSYVRFNDMEFDSVGIDSLVIYLDHITDVGYDTTFFTLDSLDGSIIAFILPNDSSCTTYTTTLLDNIIGIHDIYVTIDSLTAYVYMVFFGKSIVANEITIYRTYPTIIQKLPLRNNTQMVFIRRKYE